MRAWFLVLGLALASVAGACASKDAGTAHAEPKTDPQACAPCHLDEFDAVKRPPHAGVKPTTCGICHTQNGWHPSVLSHAWPLTGAHAKTDACFECHKGDPAVFHGTPKACYGCHAADYQKGPHHVADHYPQTCEECHSTTAWKPILTSAKVPAKVSTPSEVSETPTNDSTTTTNPKVKPAKTKPPTAATPPSTQTAATTTSWTPSPDATSAASPRHH